jgi:signal peptidase II
LLLFLLSCDIASKMIAQQAIPPVSLYRFSYPFGGIGIFSDWLGGITFSLNLATNTGAAWGAFSGYPGILFALRSGVIIALVVYLFKNRKDASKFPLWLIATGALGNVIDYALYGHVIDFLHFTFWGYSFPIFNIADSCITVGVLSLFLFPKVKRLQVS